jgi:ankyrin repeat protein
LKHGVEPDHRTPVDTINFPGATALHIAAYYGKINVVQMLLETAGAKIDLKDKNGDTAVHYAAKGGQTQTLRVLNALNANFTAKNNNNHLPISLAILNSGNGEAISFL